MCLTMPGKPRSSWHSGARRPSPGACAGSCRQQTRRRARARACAAARPAAAAAPRPTPRPPGCQPLAARATAPLRTACCPARAHCPPVHETDFGDRLFVWELSTRVMPCLTRSERNAWRQDNANKRHLRGRAAPHACGDARLRLASGRGLPPGTHGKALALTWSQRARCGRRGRCRRGRPRARRRPASLGCPGSRASRRA